MRVFEKQKLALMGVLHQKEQKTERKRFMTLGFDLISQITERSQVAQFAHHIFCIIFRRQSCRRDSSPDGILRTCALKTNGNLGCVLEL